MSNDPTGGRAQPTTPIYDETVEAIAIDGTQDDRSGSPSTADRAKQQAADSAGQAKDTARQTADVAKDQAGQVASSAKDAGSRVAGTTKDQASRVAKDALGQARDLYGQATGELSDQASKQQRSAASTLRTFGEDLGRMHEGQDGGLAAELVQSLSRRAGSAASWLENREPTEVLDEVKQFAARRPTLFIGLAAVAGIVAARATKALIAEAKPDSATNAGSGTTTDRATTGGTDADRAERSVLHDPAAPVDGRGGIR